MELKDLLGEDLYKQVTTKLGDNKYVFGAAENYIPKHRFDEVNNTIESYKTQITDRDKQLTDLKKVAGDNADLTKKIADMTEINKKAAGELVAAKRNFAIDSVLLQAKAKNPKALRALIDDSKITFDNDKLAGLDEQLEAIKKSDSYLFGDDVPSGTGKGSAQGQPDTKDSFTKEQAERIRAGLF